MGDTHKKNDPIDATMSLGDHLEELRARLLLAILGLAVGAVVSLIFGKSIILFIEKPYLDVMEDRRSEVESAQMQSEGEMLVEAVFETLGTALASDVNAPKLDPAHVAFFHKVFSDAVKTWTEPGDPNNKTYLPPGDGLQVLKPAEGFVAYMKVSFIAGLILTCPWVFYQIWMFVAAGLYPHERKYVKTAVPFSAILFVVGAMFFLFLVAPLSLKFFLIFDDLLKVASNWTLQGYISFVTMLMLVFGLAFQMPIAIFILARTGLVSVAALRNVRKYVFLAVFFVAAVVTPPDVISQVTLALPLYALFELGILLASLVGDKEAQARAKAMARLLAIALGLALVGVVVSMVICVHSQALTVRLLGGTVTQTQPFLFLGRTYCHYEGELAAWRQAVVTVAGLLGPVLLGLLLLLLVPFKKLGPSRSLSIAAFFVPLLGHSVLWVAFPIMHMVGQNVHHDAVTFMTQSGFHPLIVAAIGVGLLVPSYRIFRWKTKFAQKIKALLEPS